MAASMMARRTITVASVRARREIGGINVCSRTFRGAGILPV